MKRCLLFLSLISVFATSCLASALLDARDEMGMSRTGNPLAADFLSAACPGGREGDFSLLPGWPQNMGGDPWFSPDRGMVWADITHDGYPEVIASSTDRKLYVWDCEGNLLPGWPKTLNDMAQSVPSVGDIDGDGDLEIVQGTRGMTSGGLVYAFEADGTVMPGFPLSLSGNNISGAVTLADLDGDGDLELLAAERAYPIGYLHIFHHDGNPYGANWPAELDHVPTGTPAVGDIDNDGFPEIVHMSYTSIYAYEAGGDILPGWPLTWYPDRRFSYQSPALGDLTEDGFLEIAVCTHWDDSALLVLRYDGTMVPGFPRSYSNWSYCPPTIADLDGDGHLDVLCGQAGGFVPGYNLFAYDRFGNALPGWPLYVTTGGAEGPIAVGDINDDGHNEVIFDSNLTEYGQGYLNAVDYQGNYLAEWPFRPLGFTYMNGAVLGDLNCDGIVDVGTVSSSDYDVYVNIWSLEASYHSGRVEWSQYHFDREHTGLYRPPGAGEILTIDVEPELMARARGETCTYEVTLTNLTAEDQRFQVWIDLYLSDGRPFPRNPFLGPEDIRLQPGQTAVGSISEEVPYIAPSGMYVLDFNAGIYSPLNIYDNDEVELEVTD